MVNALTLTLAALASALGLAVAALSVLLAWSRRNERRGWDLANARDRALHAEIRRGQNAAAQLDRYRPLNGKPARALLQKPGQPS